MDPDQNKLQALSDALTKIQDDLSTTISARQKLESQSSENLAVQKEFTSLSPGANIYKLVGPVLLRQDKTEANSAVGGRLDFITKEIARTEVRIKALQSEAEVKRTELVGVQQRMQAAREGVGAS